MNLKGRNNKKRLQSAYLLSWNKTNLMRFIYKTRINKQAVQSWITEAIPIKAKANVSVNSPQRTDYSILVTTRAYLYI